MPDEPECSGSAGQSEPMVTRESAEGVLRRAGHTQQSIDQILARSGFPLPMSVLQRRGGRIRTLDRCP
jgi:hypothetical protein